VRGFITQQCSLKHAKVLDVDGTSNICTETLSCSRKVNFSISFIIWTGRLGIIQRLNTIEAGAYAFSNLISIDYDLGDMNCQKLH
jgi:hypothetical protein